MRRVLRGIDWTRDGYAAIVARLVRVSSLSLLLTAASRPASGWLAKTHAHGLPAAGGPGRLLRARCSCRRAPPSRARARRRAGGGDPARRPGRRGTLAIVGFSLLDGGAQSNSAFLVVRSSPSPSARMRQERPCRRDRARLRRDAGRCGGQCLRLQPAAHHRARHRRRLRIQLQDLRGRPPAEMARPCSGWSSRRTRTRAGARLLHLRAPTRRSLFLDIDRDKAQALGVCAWATSSARCRRRSAASTSTTSTCSAAPGR
jgi:hypothetical protein